MKTTVSSTVLVLSPFLDGGDKVLRFVQYFLRFLVELEALSLQRALTDFFPALKLIARKCLEVRRVLRFLKHPSLLTRLASRLNALKPGGPTLKGGEFLRVWLQLLADTTFLLFLIAEHLIYFQSHQLFPHLQKLYSTNLLLSDVLWLCESCLQLLLCGLEARASRSRRELRKSLIAAGKNCADVATVYGFLTNRWARPTPYLVGSLSSLLALSLYIA